MQQFVDLVKTAILDPMTRASVISLLEALMQDEGTRERLTNLLAFAFVQDNVKNSVTSTIETALHQTMSNEDIQVQ